MMENELSGYERRFTTIGDILDCCFDSPRPICGDCDYQKECEAVFGTELDSRVAETWSVSNELPEEYIEDVVKMPLDDIWNMCIDEQEERGGCCTCYLKDFCESLIALHADRQMALDNLDMMEGW